AVVLALSCGHGMLEGSFHPGQVIGMDTRAPRVAADFLGAFGQSVDSDIACGHLHPLHSHIQRECSDQRELAGKRELRVALGKYPLAMLALRDVKSDAEQLHSLIGAIAHHGALDGNPALSTSARLLRV